MITKLLSGVFLVYLVLLTGRVHSFCDRSSLDLHADLTRAVVRSSDWLKKIYTANTTVLFPHRAASLISIIRLAGHMPETILSEFKNHKGENIEETLKNYLDLRQEKEGNLNAIPAAELALIIQAVISICHDPDNFHGHNLTCALIYGFTLFKKVSSFNNYFRYSLAVIALCNSGRSVPDAVVRELINGTYRQVSYHMTDIDSLILQALSCVSNSSLQGEVNKASQKLVTQLISKQNRKTGAVGNHISTSHVLKALRAAQVPTEKYLCEKALRNILTYQDREGSFGTILSNIRITTALLGESLISLKKYACPVEPLPTEPPPIITVHVQIVFNVANMTRKEPSVTVKVPRGKTNYDLLDVAKLQNPCYAATYRKTSWGRSVMSICGVAKQPMLGYYWLTWVNGRKPHYGRDGKFRPKDGDFVTFRYIKITF